MCRFCLILFCMTLIGGMNSVQAQAPFVPKTGLVTENGDSDILKKVKFDQHLGVTLSLDTEFRDETGKTVRLGDYFGKRPVVFALVYHECPMLCNVVLNSLVTSLRGIEFTPGKEFDVLTISISPTETHTLAAAKRKGYVAKYGKTETLEHWHFLTGDEPNIRKIADECGFNYEYDPKSGHYAHAGGIMILTPEGKISRYLFGVDYSTRDVRFGIIDASEEKIGSPITQLLMMCFHYDPATGRYSLAVLRILQAAGLATIIGMGMYIAKMLMSERRRESGVYHAAG